MRKRTLVCSLTALSFGLAVSPSMAGTVYVPIPKANEGDGSTQAVEVWVSNTGATQRPFTTTFLKAESDGTKRDGAPPPPTNRIPGGRLFFINNAGANGEAGLLEVDATPELHVEARLKSVAAGGALSFSSVPIISSDNLVSGGDTATLLGLSRDGAGGHTDLAVVNLGQQSTQCQVKLFRADATQIGGTSVVTLKPLSTRLFDDALGILGEQQAADVRAQVACDAPFFAYATLFNPRQSQLVFVTPAASGSSALTVPGKPGGAPVDPGALLYELPGFIHEPTQGNEAREFTIPVANALVLKKLVVDMDFVPGPWNTSKVPGNHALVWIYRGRYRSGTIVNVNAFGPGKFAIKMNQNVDMPAGHVTAKEAPLTVEQGQLYHLHYEYNAETNRVSFEVSQNGVVLAAATMDGTAKNGRLNIPSTSEAPLKLQFGHMRGQEGPEIPSYRWKYSNLRVQLIPY